MTTIASALQAVRLRISAAAREAGREPGEIALLAVSKTFPAEAVRAACAAGQTAFGENYLQEALAKMALLRDLPLAWHFIGPLQSNKTRAVAENFAWVHGLDRAKIADRLSAARPAELPPLQVCIEVNLDGECSKGGVAPDGVVALATHVRGLPRLKLRGLMAIPAPAAGTAAQRRAFHSLRALRDELNRAGHQLDTLSMGMSGDLEAAIAEYATIVRVGSAIFGARMNPSPDDDASLYREAGRCVACGLCLPHCPTYRKTLNEADSPRGRIFMMAGVLDGTLAPAPELLVHLDLCLGCRACESVCPSLVRYGRLLDGMRARLEPRSRPLRQALTRRALFGVAAMPRLLRGAGRLLPLLGRRAPPAPGHYPATGMQRGEVALFLGCVARLIDADTLQAAMFVLNRLGYAVRVPEGQNCCGALHRHGGEAGRAERLADGNRAAFAAPGGSAILHVSSGCGAALAEYDPPLVAPVLDICVFLADARGWDEIPLAPLDRAIALHESCAGRNVLRDQDAAYALLRRIPGASVFPLPGNAQCCGAAGIYHLTQPAMAAALLRDKIEAVRDSGARTIASTNPGCAIHLAAGLRQAGWEIDVLHPVTLIARQMGYPR